MDYDYVAYFERKQTTRKYIVWAFLLILCLGIPIWFYIYSYLETADFGIEKLGIERYNERNSDALLFTFFIVVANSFIALPSFIFINRFFKRYKNVLHQLNGEEIKTLEKINNALRGYDKFMPSFILTDRYLHVFSLKQYDIALQSIKNYSITRVQTLYSFDYKIDINTSDGKNYSFRISNNHSQLDYLKIYLQGKT